MDDNADAKRILLAPSGRLEKTTGSSPHHMAQHHPTGSEASPSYALRSSRFGSEPPSVEDDVDVWRYAFVSCMPETTNETRLALAGHDRRYLVRIAVTVYRCLHGTAPEYLSELFVSASTRSSRYWLRFSNSNQFIVPPVKLSTYGWRAFSVSGQLFGTVSRNISKVPTLSVDSFRRYLKTYLFVRY